MPVSAVYALNLSVCVPCAAAAAAAAWADARLWNCSLKWSERARFKIETNRFFVVCETCNPQNWLPLLRPPSLLLLLSLRFYVHCSFRGPLTEPASQYASFRAKNFACLASSGGHANWPNKGAAGDRLGVTFSGAKFELTPESPPLSFPLLVLQQARCQLIRRRNSTLVFRVTWSLFHGKQ